jgi:hypothetical protein
MHSNIPCTIAFPDLIRAAVGNKGMGKGQDAVGGSGLAVTLGFSSCGA